MANASQLCTRNPTREIGSTMEVEARGTGDTQGGARRAVILVEVAAGGAAPRTNYSVHGLALNVTAAMN